MRGEKQYRRKVVAIAGRLPEVEMTEEGRHIGLRVRKRTFAWYQVDHHGDGMITLVCKAAPGAQEALVSDDPERFFVPAFLGPRGWLGIDLEAPDLDWSEVEDLLKEAYVLLAPKRLAAQVV
jgi:hypothetical protein